MNTSFVQHEKRSIWVEDYREFISEASSPFEKWAVDLPIHSLYYPFKLLPLLLGSWVPFLVANHRRQQAT